MIKLNNKDYIKILKYYNIHPTKNYNKNKITAENILANKLCRCIKKVSKKSKIQESKAIAICKNSIFTKKNIKLYKFKCKKKYRLIGKKTKKQTIKLYK